MYFFHWNSVEPVMYFLQENTDCMKKVRMLYVSKDIGEVLKNTYVVVCENDLHQPSLISNVSSFNE